MYVQASHCLLFLTNFPQASATRLSLSSFASITLPTLVYELFLLAIQVLLSFLVFYSGKLLRFYSYSTLDNDHCRLAFSVIQRRTIL